MLSDGLGSGVKANILATLTSKIIATMMKAGATLEDTVDTIIHTLPVCKVRHMAYSTFSILKLTPEGTVYLTEFDCPGCIYTHDGVVYPIDYTTREVGGKTIKEAVFDLECGDMLTLISDGVMYAGIGAVLNLGWNWESVCEFLEDNWKDENTSARMTAALLRRHRQGDSGTNCQPVFRPAPVPAGRRAGGGGFHVAGRPENRLRRQQCQPGGPGSGPGGHHRPEL